MTFYAKKKKGSPAGIVFLLYLENSQKKKKKKREKEKKNELGDDGKSYMSPFSIYNESSNLCEQELFRPPN